MRLDRNIIGNAGKGKYALVKLRVLDDLTDAAEAEAAAAIKTLEALGVLDWGTSPETEFFVMRLRDRYARVPLHAYADEAQRDGQTEFAAEVSELALRAGVHNPHCKRPD